MNSIKYQEQLRIMYITTRIFNPSKGHKCTTIHFAHRMMLLGDEIEGETWSCNGGVTYILVVMVCCSILSYEITIHRQ